MNLRLLIVLATLTSLVVLAPLGHATLPPRVAETAISVVDNAFQPAGVNIPIGATVTWTLAGSAAHTTTSETGLWDSGTLSAAQPFSFTFDAPGVFHFFCKNHTGMTGTITVTRPAYLPIVLHNAADAPIDLTATSEAATWTAEAMPTSTGTVTVKPTETMGSTTPTAPTAGPATMTAEAMGTPTPTPSSTPTEESGQSYGLHGAVQIRPRWATTISQPIAYEIILDVSGSMSWNFAGQAGDSSNPVQCAGVSLTSPCFNGWNPVSERRIYSVKQALSQFIDAMGATDTMRIVSFSGNLSSNYSEQNAINSLTKAWPSSGWSSNKTVLKHAIQSAGAINGDPYFTRGASSNATALASGRQVLAGAPPTAPNGQPYRRVVIFLTDSVAHVFLDGELNSAQDICPGISGLDIAACQVGVTASGRLRPITAMADQANRMKQDHPTVALYVVALGGMDTTGLSDVASAPSLLYEALQPAEVVPVLDLIRDSQQWAICTPAGGAQWVAQVDAQHTPEFPPPNNLPPGVFGYVYLYDQDGDPLPAGQHQLPITHDPVSGTLTFTLPANQGLVPGAYQVSAFAGYKGEDAASRQYDTIFNPNFQVGDARRAFTLVGSGSSVIEIEPLLLDLNWTVQVCP